jgi:hypothetical protein
MVHQEQKPALRQQKTIAQTISKERGLMGKNVELAG